MATVVLEELEALEEMEEAELERERVLRGANMPLTSSAFIGLPPLPFPHAGRDICENVGGFATAVIRKVLLVNFHRSLSTLVTFKGVEAIVQCVGS